MICIVIESIDREYSTSHVYHGPFATSKEAGDWIRRGTWRAGHRFEVDSLNPPSSDFRTITVWEGETKIVEKVPIAK